MEVFGIGPAELVFIFVLALLVLGPERLPEVGRFLGHMVARLLAWQQRSPEYQVVQQIRQDMEREIVGLRDEIVRTKQQFAASTQPWQQELRSINQALTRPGPLVAALPTSTPTEANERIRQPIPTSNPNRTSTSNNGATSIAKASPPDPPDPQESNTNSSAPADVPLVAPTALPDEATLRMETTLHLLCDDVTLLRAQVQALMSDMHAMQTQMRRRGYLSDDWHPPSHAIHYQETFSTEDA